MLKTRRVSFDVSSGKLCGRGPESSFSCSQISSSASRLPISGIGPVSVLVLRINQDRFDNDVISVGMEEES